ncbi:MAG: YqgE/AlgH family protein [Candidatus Binatia bacterium]
MTIPVLCTWLALTAAGGHCPSPLPASAVAAADPVVAVRAGRLPPSTQPAAGHFLIAKHSLSDPNFAESVILLLSYGGGGAMGIIINRPTEMRLKSAFPQVQELQKRDDRLFVGGPVSLSSILLLVRSKGRLERAQQIFDNVHVSSSMQVLREVARGAGKTVRLRAYAGYAGWGPGQLDHEIERGDWLIAPADATSIFDTKPADVWSKLVDRFSVEWTRAPGDGDPSIITGAILAQG